jgi:uncharacterized protein (DUF2141 family)
MKPYQAYLSFIIAFVIGVIPSNGQSEKTYPIKVEVTDLRNNKGTVNLAVFNSKKGFPNDVENAVRKAQSAIKEGKATFTLELPSGNYAISLFHDENGNDEFDTNWIGLPKEGAAASNNAKAFMGPPKFEDAEFELKQQTVWQSIRMIYF